MPDTSICNVAASEFVRYFLTSPTLLPLPPRFTLLSVDVDNSGQIHYTEFLAATMEAHGHIEEDRLAEAFDRLDCDDSGYITRENLKEILGTEYTKQKADEFIAEADVDNNGKICWDEFKTMFERRHQKDMKDFMGGQQSTVAESDRNLLGVDADIPKD